MRLIVTDSYEKMGMEAANIVAGQVYLKPNSVLGLATGSTPVSMYQRLVAVHQSVGLDFSEVTTFNLDEYIGLEGTHDQSYRYFMNKYLFDGLDIDKARTHVLKGVGDYLAYANQYDALIASFGGIDLQILGIGSDGHIAFNEPGTPFDSLTHVAELTEQTIKDNSRLFNDISEVPTKAVTMGLKSIMNARKIVLIATGKNKAQAIYNLLKGPMTEEVPCSILQKHPDCTIYVDEDAYSLVK